MLLYQTFFFLSGFTSLLYEVALVRLFLPVFGVGILSVTAVLGAFFLGMALGSLAVPRLLLRFARPALLYPLLELITGLTAVLLPLALTPLVGLYTGISPPEAGAGSLTAIRFFLATGVMLLPTFAMGGAFPACIEFCRLRSRSDDFLQGARAASLYGANLLGAAVGSAVGGFILLPNLGVSGTFFTISALSLGLAGAAYLLAIRSPVSSVGAPPPQEGLESQRSTLPLLALYLFAGVITVSLELIWYRTLVIHVGASVHSFAILLTTFLLGSAIGSFVIGLALRDPRKKSQLGNIAFTFVLIALTSYSSLQLIVSKSEIFTPTLLGVGWGGKLLREFFHSALFVFPTVMLFGALFSLLAAELRRRGKDDTRTVGDLFATNSIGAVVGAFLCTFIFLEFLGVQRSIELFAAVIMLVGISLGWQQWSSNRTLATAGILALILSYWVHSPRDLLPQKFAERLGPIGFYKESARDITIAHEMPGTKNRRLAFHDARGTCSTRKAENEVARLLAHTSMAMNPQAKTVLVISYGCGNTTSAFAQYPLERIDIADLSESVREASQFFWTNKGVANEEFSSPF
jgi:spermidine synthase